MQGVILCFFVFVQCTDKLLFYDNYIFGFNSGSLTVSPTYNGALVGANMINTAYQVDLNDSVGNQKSLVSSSFLSMLNEIKNSFYKV